MLSIAVGLAGAAGVAASGWALQAAALPPPTPAARVAADASAWLHAYRLSVDTFHFDHRRIGGACLRGWFGHAHGRRVRASLLSLRPGGVLRASDGRHLRISFVRGHPDRLLPARLAATAGCTAELAAAVAVAAQEGVHLTAERAYAANRPAVALALPRHIDKALTLYVAPRTDQPLVAIVSNGDEQVTARLYLNRVSRSLLTRFHLPREAHVPKGR